MTRQTSGSHAAPRRRAARRADSTSRSTRIKAVLCLGVVVCLGTTGTWASWSDKGTITGAAIQTGTLDLTAGPTTGAENLVGAGSTNGSDAASNWDYSTLGITDMTPGESISKMVVVRNSGTAAFTVNGTVTTTTNDLTSGTAGLQVQVFDQATGATSSTNATTGFRTAACTGGTQVYSQYVSTTSTGTAIFATAPTLTKTQTRSLCVRVVLDTNAPNALQSTSTVTKSTKVVLKLDATQVTS